MLDMEQNRPIEVEVILGEVVRMAKARGLEMPVGRLSISERWVLLNVSSASRNALRTSPGGPEPDPAQDRDVEASIRTAVVGPSTAVPTPRYLLPGPLPQQETGNSE